MPKTNDFAVLIDTHGRPKDQLTYSALREAGYTGEVYFLIDNEDETEAEYRAIYGDHVIVFDKQKYIANTDSFLPNAPRLSVVYARNAGFDIARELGLKWFAMCDDDIKRFDYKLVIDGKLKGAKASHLDSVINSAISFAESAKLECVATCEMGIYVGGANNPKVKNGFNWSLSHFWIFRTESLLRFRGYFFEDIIFSCLVGSTGKRALALINIAATTLVAGKGFKQSGGMVSTYAAESYEYVGAYLCFMVYPSQIRIVVKDGAFTHEHSETHGNAKILSGRWKK